ncbi:hypothetical protein TKK_0013031 [Trichogramma kaykai]
MFLCKQVGTGTSSRTNTLTVPFEHFFSSLFQCTLHQLVKLQITFAPHSYGTHLFRYSLGYDTDHICSTTQQQQNINPGIHWEKEVIKRSHENYDVRQLIINWPNQMLQMELDSKRTNTHTYTNNIAGSHHVFLNLHALNFYCLPDNYEIIDSSLDDIKFVLNPTFYRADIEPRRVVLDNDALVAGDQGAAQEAHKRIESLQQHNRAGDLKAED